MLGSARVELFILEFLETGVELRRSIGWRKRLLIGFGVAIGFFALVLRLLGESSSRALASVFEGIVSFVVSLVPFTLAGVVTISALVFLTRRRVKLLLLRRVKEYNIIVRIPPTVDKGSLLISALGRGRQFAMSRLALLSVPSEGVRLRVRGEVSRDEREWGAAVSDEKQYQFSHLASLANLRGISFELSFHEGLVDIGFTVTGKDNKECVTKRDQVNAALVAKLPTGFASVSGDSLVGKVLLSLDHGQVRLDGGYEMRLQLAAAKRRVVRVVASGTNSKALYMSVVTLRGRPEMSAHEQRSQIDQFISGVDSLSKGSYDVDYVVSFDPRKAPKRPSDAKLRGRLVERPDIKLSLERKKVEVEAMEVQFGERVGWWSVSVYAVVVGDGAEEVEGRAESVGRLIKSVWTGSHFSPEFDLLHAKEVVNNFPRILQRNLLPRRYVTEMSSMRLSSLVHVPEEPHAPLGRGTAPLFDTPTPDRFSSAEDGGGCLRFGDVLSFAGQVLYPLVLPVTAFRTHMIVLGESGFGKTCFVLNMLRMALRAEDGDAKKGRFLDTLVPFLVLDLKGEYRSLISRLENRVIYFLPASDYAPLYINLFDPQGDDAESHAKYVFHIMREILFTNNRTELTPQMERVLYDVLRMNVGGDWSTFNKNLSKYLEEHGDELPQLGATVQGILNRVGLFVRPPLSHVFSCKRSNVNFSYLVERCVMVDLSELRRHGTPEDVRLLANIIAKYVSVAAVRRGVDYSGELRHLFIVDDALDVVPEILGKRTTADVGIVEYMAMLLRAMGQGLVVVSQRPNISENVIANSATKVFFRTVVDSREVASWINLSAEQEKYLKVLPAREAIITVPGYPAPMRVRAPDVSDVIGRRVTRREIVANNMMNYPLMYDMQKEEEAGLGCLDAGAETEAKKEEESSDQNEENKVEEEGLSELDEEARAAWLKLKGCLVGHSAVDSEFVSAKLGVSAREVHRIMLSLRRAGLVGCARIPNYAFGKGMQYAYYHCAKEEREKGFPYGGGIVGYIRERMQSDLTGRELVVQLSPREVPSADMIVQHNFPIIIHLTSAEENLGRSTLGDRIRKVVDEFSNSCLVKGADLPNTGGWVVVVTLWSSTARLINQQVHDETARGVESYVLCAIPFSRRWVNLIADYALHHICLDTLLSGGEQHDGREEEEASNDDGKQGEGERKKEEEPSKVVEKQDEANVEKESGVRIEEKKEEFREKVLSLVREHCGIQPRAVADKLGVRLARVSEAAGALKEEGLIKVAKNIPYVSSLRKANAVYYLDAWKQTALHDTVMNLIWEWNIELSGRSRDFSFEFGGKTWCTDGLLENSGGNFLLEVVSGGFSERVVEQLRAYSSQVGHMSIKGTVVVVVDRACLGKLREEVTTRGIRLGAGLIIALRSRDEKLQAKSLLLEGSPMAYHRNSTAS